MNIKFTEEYYKKIRDKLEKKYGNSMIEILQRRDNITSENLGGTIIDLMREIYGDSFFLGNFMDYISNSNVLVENVDIKQRISDLLKKGCEEFFFPYRLQEFYETVLMEVLYYIRVNSAWADTARKVVVIDGEKIWFIEDDKSELKEFQKNEYNFKDNIWELENNLSYILQIKLNENAVMKNFVNNGSRKKTDFETFFKDTMKLEEGLLGYEKYIIEKHTCVLQSWEILDVMQEFLEMPGKTKEEDVKNILEKIVLIGENISKSHNLYFRLHLICYLRLAAEELKGKSGITVLDGLQEIIETIEENVCDFNECYEDLFIALLYILNGRETLISYVEDKYENTILKEMLDELTKQVEKIKKDEIGTYREYKLWNLWFSNNKSILYGWYKRIWKNMKRGYRDFEI